uniref:GPI transamidase component PIG-S n=2 Tax=Araucaria cunninghamii TaxID=56994 RepID=A0A0D6R401_ARACU
MIHLQVPQFRSKVRGVTARMESKDDGTGARMENKEDGTTVRMENKDDGTRRIRRPGRKRLAITLSVFISFLIGLPIWLKSTEVYRTHLPYEAIDSLANNVKSKPLVLPCQFNVILLELKSETGNDGDHDAVKKYLEGLRSVVLEQLRSRINRNGIGSHGGCGNDYFVTVSLDSKDKCVEAGITNGSSNWSCGLGKYLSSVDISSDDDVVDELLNSYSGRVAGDLDGNGGVYSIVVTGDGHSRRTVIGKHRHAWIVGEYSESILVPLIGEIIVKYFMNGGILMRRHGTRSEKGDEKDMSMPLAADGSAILSFSLLNAEPADWIYQWDFEMFGKQFLSPLVEMLAPVASLSVESQVLYHTPKAAHSYWDEQLASYVFHVDDLPFFVNSNEWHLDTSVAAAGRSKILQFAIYIPSSLECPLRLKLPNGKLSATNGFTSPGWGGIIVLNPLSCVTSALSGKHQRHELSEEEFGPVMQVVVGQIRTLLGLPPTAPHDTKKHISSISASQTGFSEWELDALLRRRVVADVASCSLTLASLSRLVKSLPSMVIMDEIGDQVFQSLEAANLARKNSFTGMYHAAAESARKARAWAEEAFFQPSIMSLLYFPTEHHFAIYTPFFVPVLVHTFIAAAKEVTRYRREWKKFLKSNVHEQVS